MSWRRPTTSRPSIQTAAPSSLFTANCHAPDRSSRMPPSSFRRNRSVFASAYAPWKRAPSAPVSSVAPNEAEVVSTLGVRAAKSASMVS